MRHLSRRDALAGTAAVAGASAVTPAIAGLADDNELKSLWREYVKTLGNASIVGYHCSHAEERAFDEIKHSNEALDARVKKERKDFRKAHPPKPVHVRGEGLTTDQADMVVQLAEGLYAPRYDESWVKAERESIKEKINRKHGIREVNKRYERSNLHALQLRIKMCEAKAHTVEGVAIKLALATEVALNDFDSEEAEAAYEAFLDVFGGHNLATRARHVDLYAFEHGRLPA